MTMSIPPRGEPSINQPVVSYVKKTPKNPGHYWKTSPSMKTKVGMTQETFAKPVKAISLPQDVLITSDHHLIELENQVQRLMEAHLDPNSSVQVNKITSSCEIYSGPHDTQYCMENPEQAFGDYTSLRTNEARDVRLSKFEADFKQQQSEMTNKIDTFLKAINDRMMGELPSDTVKNPKFNVNPTSSVSSARSYPMEDPQSSSLLAHDPIYNVILDKYVESLELGKNGFVFIQSEMPENVKDPRLFTLPCRLGDTKPFYTLADLGSCVNLILLYLFKKLKIRLLEETDHVFRLADGIKSYPVGIVKNVEVHIGKLKLLEDFYVIDIDKDPSTPSLIGRGFLATASAVIDFKKAKITVGEGITRYPTPLLCQEILHGLPFAQRLGNG
ncbi:MAK10-like protein [Tanacetum coccineum]